MLYFYQSVKEAKASLALEIKEIGGKDNEMVDFMDHKLGWANSDQGDWSVAHLGTSSWDSLVSRRRLSDGMVLAGPE
jgi:hypothetical protein